MEPTTEMIEAAARALAQDAANRNDMMTYPNWESMPHSFAEMYRAKARAALSAALAAAPSVDDADKWVAEWRKTVRNADSATFEGYWDKYVASLESIGDELANRLAAAPTQDEGGVRIALDRVREMYQNNDITDYETYVEIHEMIEEAAVLAAPATAEPEPLYLVTIKLPKNPKHDPRNKKTAGCPVSEECTDSTGEHHTVIARSEAEVEDVRKTFEHITRVEKASSWVDDSAAPRCVCAFKGMKDQCPKCARPSEEEREKLEARARTFAQKQNDWAESHEQPFGLDEDSFVAGAEWAAAEVLPPVGSGRKLTAWPTKGEILATFCAEDRLSFGRWLSAYEQTLMGKPAPVSRDAELIAEAKAQADYLDGQIGIAHLAGLIRRLVEAYEAVTK